MPGLIDINKIPSDCPSAALYFAIRVFMAALEMVYELAFGMEYLLVS